MIVCSESFEVKFTLCLSERADVLVCRISENADLFVSFSWVMQCLPVVLHGTRADVMMACVKESNLWPLFHKLQLNINIRAQEDNTGYADWLLQLGNDTLKGIHRGLDTLVPIPPEFIVDNMQTLIRSVFGDLRPFDIPHKAILSPFNVDCDIINDSICETFPGVAHTYYSADALAEDDQGINSYYPVEFLNSITPSGSPPHALYLKEGVIVMVLRNLNVRAGICNGTRCLVRRLAENFVDVEILSTSGRRTGERTFIPRIDFLPVDTGLPFRMKRRQYPLRIAYATTINKSQGQTYDAVGIYLERPVFTHGQLYVAFSRAKRRDSVFVVIRPAPSQGKLFNDKDDIYTKNIVYREALL